MCSDRFLYIPIYTFLLIYTSKTVHLQFKIERIHALFFFFFARFSVGQKACHSMFPQGSDCCSYGVYTVYILRRCPICVCLCWSKPTCIFTFVPHADPLTHSGTVSPLTASPKLPSPSVSFPFLLGWILWSLSVVGISVKTFSSSGSQQKLQCCWAVIFIWNVWI